MWHSIGRTAVAQVQSLLRGFLQEGSCPFSTVLTVKDIMDLTRQECGETSDRIFPPVVTRCTFLRQIHSDDPSCRAAVARLNAARVAQGLGPCSPQTGGYCKARQRLPETLLPGLQPAAMRVSPMPRPRSRWTKATGRGSEGATPSAGTLIPSTTEWRRSRNAKSGPAEAVLRRRSPLKKRRAIGW